MSCEQIQALCAGYAKFNKRKYSGSGGSDAAGSNSLDDVPFLTPEEEARLAKRMGANQHGS